MAVAAYHPHHSAAGETERQALRVCNVRFIHLSMMTVLTEDRGCQEEEYEWKPNCKSRESFKETDETGGIPLNGRTACGFFQRSQNRPFDQVLR